MSKVKFVISAVLALTVSACGGSEAPPTPAAAAATTAGYFVVPADQIPHLKIVPAGTATWATTLHTTGTVDWDNDHTTQAITQVSGPIARIVVDTGTHVKAGDPLLYVSSPDVSNAISTYRKTKNRLALAQKTLDRSKDLLAHQAIAQRDLESAEADFNDAATDVETALQALRIFGLTKADIDDAEHQNMPIRSEIPMRAPISGTVVQKMVLPGQLIQAGTTVAFVITDPSTVWVQGHIYEKDLATVHVGDVVSMRTPSVPAEFKGTVAHIDQMVDPATRTTLVRIVTKNPGNVLRKDLFVDCTLSDRAKRDVVSVPVDAVLYDEQNMPFVYMQVEAGKFAQRLVKLGTQQDGLVEVTSGIKAGDLVVSQGSVFLQFANSIGK
jgi:cobalt-zinc-cadmium efflux system membrane fusion protein